MQESMPFLFLNTHWLKAFAVPCHLAVFLSFLYTRVTYETVQEDGFVLSFAFWACLMGIDYS